LDGLDHCRFRAVVLQGRAETLAWHYEGHFGVGFRDHLLASYAFSRIAGARALYLPHCGSPAPSTALVEGTQPETVMDRNTHPGRLKFIKDRIGSILRR